MIADANADNSCAYCVVAQSAHESGYGTSAGAIDNRHNVMGMDTVHADGTKTIRSYPSTSASVDAFFRGWGHTINGKRDIESYVHALEDGPRTFYNPQHQQYMQALREQYQTVIQEINQYRNPRM